MLKHIIITLTLSLVLGCAHRTTTVPVHPASDEVDTDTETEVPEDTETDTQLPIDKYLAAPEVADIAPLPEEPPTEAESLGISDSDLSLARAIFKWKMTYDKGLWVECGVKYKNKSEIKKAAIEWAAAINAAHATATYTLRSGKTVQVNKKEAIGVIMNESRFDRCAVGPFPRKFAYENGLLKRKGRHISHSLEELEAVFKHPLFRKRKADLGGAQIVVKVGKLSWDEIKKYLSLDPGIQIVFDEMKRRGAMYSTKTPSDRWPGSAKHTYYTNKVLRNASFIYKYL